MSDIVQTVAVELDLHDSTVRKVMFDSTSSKASIETRERILQCARGHGWEPRQYPKTAPAPLVERNNLHDTLLHTLGRDGFLLLVENYGGFRLYVPTDPHRSELPDDITIEHATTLSEHFGGAYLKIPMAREFRTLQYLKEGLSCRRIALRTGCSEQAVQRLVKRLKREYGDLR